MENGKIGSALTVDGVKKTPMNLKDQLIRDEGLRLKPYKDTVDKLTIGVGRNLDDRGISNDEAMYLLDNDIKSHTNDLLTAFPWVTKLDEARRNVLINMVFNMGIDRFKAFKLTLAAIKEGNYELAAGHMEDSLWYRQVGPRAARLASIMRTGG